MLGLVLEFAVMIGCGLCYIPLIILEMSVGNMISSFSSLRSAIIEFLDFGEGTLICNSIQTTLRLSCNYIGVFHTWRIVFAAHTQDSFLLSIIQLWGKSPETQSISLTNLNGKRPAPSTTVLGQGWQEWFTRDSLIFFGVFWFHLGFTLLFVPDGWAFN